MAHYPTKIQAKLERILLIKTDLTAIDRVLPFDTTVRDLPEVQALQHSLSEEDTKRLMIALDQAFDQNDLSRVMALYSYGTLFTDDIQQEIRQQTIEDFHRFLGISRNETDLSAMFLHAGFAQMISQLNDSNLTTVQFDLFERSYLAEENPKTARIAGVQRNLPLFDEQKMVVVRYLEQLRLKAEKVEKKNYNKTVILIIIVFLAFILRFVLRLSK